MLSEDGVTGVQPEETGGTEEMREGMRGRRKSMRNGSADDHD